MYHPLKVNHILNNMEHSYLLNGETIPYSLETYTLSEVMEYGKELDTYIDLDEWRDSGKITYIKILEPHWIRFITNERTQCKFNWRYWAERYYQIQSAHDNKFGHYQFNRTAEIFLAILGDQQLKEIAIRELNPKARQVGRSTFWAGILAHKLQFYYEIRGLLASYESEATNRLSLMVTGSGKRQPWYLSQSLTNYRQGKYYTWANDSRLDLTWGTASTMGTGFTPTIALLSEVAKYDNPKMAIDAGLLQCMHESADSILVLESTAERRNDYWHNLVKDSLRGQSVGDTSFIVSFTPWFIRDDLYPTNPWLRARSNLYANFIPSIETERYARSAENTVRTNPYFKRFLGENWFMPKEQLFFYELRKASAIRKKELHIFLREMPSTLEEAFQHAGEAIYPIEILTRYNETISSKNPDCYKLVGDSNEVPLELQPSITEIDSDKPSKEIKIRYNEDQPTYEFELKPVKFTGWDMFNPEGVILIFNHPESTFDYGFGIDTSGGMGGDNCAIEGIRNGTIWDRDSQACEFVSRHLTAEEMWPWVLTLSSYYSQFRGQQLVTVETGKGGGGPLITEMYRRGWHNFYKPKALNKLREDIASKPEYGWITNERTREFLVDHYNLLIKNEHLEIGSMALLSEMTDLRTRRTISSVLGKLKDKISGDEDNRFMAIAIGLAAMHQDAIQGHTKRPWEERLKVEAASVIPEKFDPLKHLGYKGSKIVEDLIISREDDIDVNPWRLF